MAEPNKEITDKCTERLKECKKTIFVPFNAKEITDQKQVHNNCVEKAKRGNDSPIKSNSFTYKEDYSELKPFQITTNIESSFTKDHLQLLKPEISPDFNSHIKADSKDEFSFRQFLREPLEIKNEPSYSNEKIQTDNFAEKKQQQGLCEPYPQLSKSLKQESDLILFGNIQLDSATNENIKKQGNDSNFSENIFPIQQNNPVFEHTSPQKLYNEINYLRGRQKGLLNRLIKPVGIGILDNNKRIIVAKKMREKRDVLNYPTDTDSDVEVPKVSSLWENTELESSDAESVDLELNDPFQHTMVYTEEEAAVMIRNKLVRLQNLYIKEYRRIISNMKEKHREYLTLMKKEKEMYGPLLRPKNLTAQERRKYEKLKALSQYQKHGNGPETLLFKKMIECKKVATSHMYSRSRIFNKCVYTEGGMRCSIKVVPGSKYCMKHILKDPSQVLFRACGVKKDDFKCEEPVDMIFENAKCSLHKVVPMYALGIQEQNKSE